MSSDRRQRLRAEGKACGTAVKTDGAPAKSGRRGVCGTHGNAVFVRRSGTSGRGAPQCEKRRFGRAGRVNIGENKCGGQGERVRSAQRGKTVQGKAGKRRRGGKNGRNKRAARLGLKYTVSVSAGEGTLTDSADIPVTAKYEGEDAKIVGGKQNEQSEFIVQDGAVVDTGEPVGFAGDFANAAKEGSEASITFDVVSYADGTADITLRCGNSYLMKDEI